MATVDAGPKHVDIIENDWGRGVQRLLARVTCNGTVEVTDTEDVAGWTARLLIERDTEFDEVIMPSAGKTYLECLVDDLRGGSYIFATDIHDPGLGCPFGTNNREIEMRSVSA